MSYKFITIEGNIGVGKTTFSKMLAEELGYRIVLEEFADNPFLPKFYNQPASQVISQIIKEKQRNGGTFQLEPSSQVFQQEIGKRNLSQ